MPSINLGKVVGDKGTSIRNRGAWNSTAEYFCDEHFVDFVTHKGSLWMCANTNSDSEPSDDNINWTLALSSIDTVYFEQAETRENIVSGERVNISFGKIAKFFADISAGAASTLLGTDLTKNRVLISAANGKTAVSGITTTILNYLSDLTSNVQEQLNAKINSSKIVKSTVITEEGFLMDGKTASEKFAELNGNIGNIKRAYIKKSMALAQGTNLLVSSTELANMGITSAWNQILAISGRFGTNIFPTVALTNAGVADGTYRVNLYISTSDNAIYAAAQSAWTSRTVFVLIDYIAI